jgi:hypothetical protein
MKYKLHIAYANRPDLAREAAESARDIGNIHLWPNGENPELTGLPPHIVEEHILPPLAPVSVINMMIQSSWDDDIMFWMHNDGWARPGVAKRLLRFVTDLHNSDRKWGVVWTLYDVLCCFNMKMVREVGYWDPMFFQYTGDMDYYHRIRRAGWDIVEFGPGVVHRDGSSTDPNVGEGGVSRLDAMRSGSITVKTDKQLRLRTEFREQSRFDKDYYKFKWGGLPEKEVFKKPFEDKQ